jgi:tetratricopeptide (TPR) repeat protein
MTIPCLEESIALFREIQDTLGLTKALFFYGWRWSNLGDLARARAPIEEGYILSQKIGALNMQARLTGALVWASHNPVDFAANLQYFEKGLFLFQQAGNKMGELIAFQCIGLTLAEQGHYDQAQKHLQKILSLWLKYGNKANAASTLYYLGLCALHQGFLSEASSRLLECLEMLRKVKIHDFIIASCLFILTTKINNVEYHPEQVATMLGAVEGLRLEMLPVSTDAESELNRIWDEVHQNLDEDSFTTAYDRGLTMTREEAITFGLEVGAMLK